MQYSTFVPDLSLRPAVECYWIVEGSDTTWQKITPDGFPEFIFHFADRYKVRHHGQPETLQPLAIATGQIDKPIHLQPTGATGVLGVKFSTTGIWKLFGTRMNSLTNQTVDLAVVLGDLSDMLLGQIRTCATNKDRLNVIEKFLTAHIEKSNRSSEIDVIVDDIRNSSGQIPVKEFAYRHTLSPRKMERLFLQQVGVSAKVYSRIIRFASVYKLLKQPLLTKAEATYLSGYFDQAHFNKEFRTFAGESPEAYFNQDHSFSNFFLDR